MPTKRKPAREIFCVDCQVALGMVVSPGRPPSRCGDCNDQHRATYMARLMAGKRIQARARAGVYQFIANTPQPTRMTKTERKMRINNELR